MTDYDDWWNFPDDDEEFDNDISDASMFSYQDIILKGEGLADDWADLLGGFGLPADTQIIVDLSNVDVADVRPRPFAELTDALNFLFGIGVIGFSKVVRGRVGDEDVWFAVIPERTP